MEKCLDVTAGTALLSRFLTMTGRAVPLSHYADVMNDGVRVVMFRLRARLMDGRGDSGFAKCRIKNAECRMLLRYAERSLRGKRKRPSDVVRDSSTRPMALVGMTL